MATLVEKLRKARESTVDAAGFRFTIRRPTDLQIIDFRGSATTAGLLVYVVGWAKVDGSPVTEIDLGLPGGEPHPLAFDAEACTEFISDRKDLLEVVTKAITEAYFAHAEAMGDATKKLTDWLEEADLPFGPVAVTTTNAFAFAPRTRRDVISKAWNLMGGEIQWPALELLAEMLGIDDVELFICELVAIREFNRRADDAT